MPITYRPSRIFEDTGDVDRADHRCLDLDSFEGLEMAKHPDKVRF